MRDSTFLADLLKKEAAVRLIGEKSGKVVNSAVTEVKRQIRQALTGGDLKVGEGVTKSGNEN